mgnify:CR=1 FL=1
MDVGVGRENLVQLLDDSRWHWRAGDEDAAESGECDAAFDTVGRDAFPECRGAEGAGDFLVADGVHDVGRVDAGRVRRVHVGHNDGHAHEDAEESEERKGRQVDFAGLDVVGGLDHADLGVEHAVLVDDALGRTGAAAGKEDSGGFVGGSRSDKECIGGSAREVAEGGGGPEPPTADGHGVFDCSEGARAEDADGMGEGNTDEGVKVDGADAVEESGDAHAGVDEDGYRAYFE